LGEYCEKYDSLHDAHKYNKKFLEIAKSISDKRPDSIEAQRDFVLFKEFLKKAQNLFSILNLKSIENFDDLLRNIE